MVHDKIETIANYYGKTPQEDKLIEEMSELTKQIIKNRYEKFDRENTISEISDVYLMLEQVIFLNDINANEVYNGIKFKIDRTIKRINKDNKKGEII